MESDPGLLTALAAGLVSFLSPCVLPLVPGYLSTISGVAYADLDESGWRHVLVPSLLFVASFSTIFICLGLSATALGSALIENQQTLEEIAAVLMVAMGVLFIASLYVVRLNREWHVDALLERAGRGGPVVAGAAFAVAWTPCIGPTLSAIFVLAAESGSEARGALLLAVYSAGLGIPFLLSAVAFDRMTRAFDAVKRHYSAIVIFGGLVLIATGVLIWTGEFKQLNISIQQFLDGLGLDVTSST